MIHISTIRSKIDNSSLVPVLQNVPKPQLSILNASLILSKIYMHIHNIHLEGTVYQIFDIGHSFIFMTKNRKNFNHFS